MNKAISLLVLGLLMVPSSSVFSQENQRSDNSPAKQKVGEVIDLKAQKFPLRQVRLLSGPFKDAMERDHEYLLRLDNNRLLHNFRVNAGLVSKAIPLGGWEAPDCELRGHFVGHYLSACALMYAATGDERLRSKADNLVAELAKCQAPSGYLSAYPEEFIDRVETGKRVWAPWYTLHKILAGLIDMCTLCDNGQALEMANKLATWAKACTDRLNDDQMQAMLKVEFGGMGEALCNLYALTGDSTYLELSWRFAKDSFLDPLIDRRDELKGLHANTHIPQAIAAAREYEMTGDPSYYDAASFFWNQIVQARSYVTGGTSNYELWLDDPYYLADQLGAESHENCCTYNMLKLTQHIFSWSADPRVMDYYERALFNGILPTQKPGDGGAIMYYVPMRSGLFKIFGIPDSSYYCCNGTGIESFAKFGSSIYSHDTGEVFVNLFIASKLNWEEKGIRLRQETNFPEREGTSIIVGLSKPMDFSLRLRIPYWVTGGVDVKLNGKSLVTSGPSSYLTIERVWRDGDRIDAHMPMDFHLWYMPDAPTMAAVMYGPLVLAGEMGTEGMTKEMQSGYLLPDVDRAVFQSAAMATPSLVTSQADPNAWIKPVQGKTLTFRTVNVGRPADLTLTPFYKMFGQRYAIYWNMYTEAEWGERQKAKASQPVGTVDIVKIGDRLSHRDHNFQAFKFQLGDSLGHAWVKSPQWFRYDFNVDPALPLALRCTYRGNEKDCAFDILIDGQQLAGQTLNGDRGNQLFEVDYPIPPELILGKHRVAVMFRAKDKKPTGELYGCAVVRSK